MPGDFDRWAAWGNPLWGHDKVFPYLLMLESDQDFQDEFHGAHGPITCHRYRPDEWGPQQHAFYRACLDAGYPHCPGHNRPGSTGVGPLAFNLAGRVRVSAAIAYLDQARTRPNLQLRPHSHVHRVLFEKSRAIGVRVAGDGSETDFFGDEIILGAGAVGSPHLLDDPFDRTRMRESVRICAGLLRDEAFDGIIERRVMLPDEVLDDNAALDTWMKQAVITAHHISGTCKMGPLDDPLAVVDQYSRIHGLDGLRVVDASIMLDTVRVNLNLTVMALGERAAEPIKGLG